MPTLHSRAWAPSSSALRYALIVYSGYLPERAPPCATTRTRGEGKPSTPDHSRETRATADTAEEGNAPLRNESDGSTVSETGPQTPAALGAAPHFQRRGGALPHPQRHVLERTWHCRDVDVGTARWDWWDWGEKPGTPKKLTPWCARGMPGECLSLHPRLG